MWIKGLAWMDGYMAVLCISYHRQSINMRADKVGSKEKVSLLGHAQLPKLPKIVFLFLIF